MAHILAILCSIICFTSAFDWDEITPLDEYVWREYEDDPYSYEVHEGFVTEDYTMYTLNMTSQRWMDDTIVAPEDTIWKHWVTVVIPNNIVISDAALLYITGGTKTSDPPTPEDGTSERLIEFALRTGAVAASVQNIPHQPTQFVDDTLPRTEDQIIARTWRYFIEGIVNDTDVNLLLPMTRAAKRAVDTVIDFTNDFDGINIDKIMPSGRSKRGWTSWLLSCVDQRVFSLVPIVLDILNWHDNLHHHYQAYGGWSWAFQPYWAEEVSRYINHSRSIYMGDEIAIDPLAYNIRLNGKPKLIIIGTSDEFFLPDDTHYFFLDLNGPKYIQLMENGNHGFSPYHLDKQWRNMANFFLTSYNNPDSFPNLGWTRYDDETMGGSLIMTVESGNVRFVRGWMADTTNVTVEVDEEGNSKARRDFRLRTLTDDNPVEFTETEVMQDGNTYTLAFDRPEEGYRGFFMEVGFTGTDPDNEEMDLIFTTEIQIIPDSLPWDRCATEEACRGNLK